MYDLLIQNGSVVDGTGSKAYLADVAAVDDEIVAIGKLEGDATRIVDAKGMVVSPGFIDLHTHSDLSFLLDPTAQSKIRQGVTFELAGNCGGSYGAPLEGGALESFKKRVSEYPDNLDVNWKDFGGQPLNAENQFLVHLGAGIESSNTQRPYSIDYRLLHVSNGGSDNPNIGINAHVVSITIPF